MFLPRRRHASLPVEVIENPVRLESGGRRRDTPCRKWTSASFGYSKTTDSPAPYLINPVSSNTTILASQM